MALFYCNCGDKFPNRKELNVHKALLNFRWPRSDPSDNHWEIDKAEMLNRQYRILNTLVKEG
jgi:hypothetical protein